MAGWTKSFRSIFSHKLFQNDLELAGFWQFLIAEAAHKDRVACYNGIEVPLKRGQLLVSKREVAKRFGWSRGKALRRFKKFLDNGMTLETNSKKAIHPPPKIDHMCTIVTIVNYDKFQDDRKRADPPPRKNGALLKNDKNTKIESKRKREDSRPVGRIISPPLSLSSEISKIPPAPVVELAKLFNESKTELLPPVDLAQINPKIVQAAVVALASEPCLETWQKVFGRVGRSRWLTGQEPSKSGKLFDTATVFEFLLSREKRMAVLEGKYDASRKKLASVPKEAVTIGWVEDNGVMKPVQEWR